MTKFKPVWPLKLIEKSSANPFLQGDRVYLAAPSLEDFDLWVDLRKRNKDFLTPYEPAWAQDALTMNFYKRRLGRQNKETQAGRGAFFFIFDIETNSLVGGINLNNIIGGAARYASLGYWLGEEFQGNGYMTEAIYLTQQYAFDVLKLRRLNAACLPDNARSISVLKRCDFKEEGYAAQYLQINGHWQDHRLFGLINPAP